MSEETAGKGAAPAGRLAGLDAVRERWRHFWRQVSRRMPKRLYARSLIIVIAPMILLQSVIAFVFMERHYDLVTQRLSQAVAREIALLISVMETYPQDEGFERITEMARQDLALSVTVLQLTTCTCASEHNN